MNDDPQWLLNAMMSDDVDCACLAAAAGGRLLERREEFR